jgi:hypothetical protein
MQFSRIELRKLHVARIALENIQSNYFLKNFKPIWNDIIKEVFVLFKKEESYPRDSATVVL